MNKFRVGFGYDVHQMVSGRDLIIGGVSIDYDKGALGHSDADALLHALADAMLGAAGMDDIGTYFPDTNEVYKNISSQQILKEVNRLISEKGYRVNNVDTTILLQEPKLSRYIPEIKRNIASILNIELSEVAVKATTTEGLGHIGKGKGIAAYAVVSLIA